MAVFNRLKRLDVFREIPKDLTEATGAGALVSIVCIVVTLTLFFSEFVQYMSIRTDSSMFVENFFEQAEDQEKLRIDINIELPSMPCALISLDAQDVMGSHVVDVGGTLTKVRLGQDGMSKKDARGRDLVSAEHLSQPQAKEQAGEGCKLQGWLLVNKVPGNFHISAHAHPELLSAVLGNTAMNTSHIVNHLSFGAQLEVSGEEVAFSPLNGVAKIAKDTFGEITHQGHSHTLMQTGSYEYYLKIVPTIHKTLRGAQTRSFQFTASSNHIQAKTFPAIYFRYDFSPITVQYSEESERFTSFIVQVFAIIGGVFTGFSIVSAWLNFGYRKMVKQRINKLG